MLSPARRTQEPGHLLYKKLVSPLCGQLRQLKSRHLFLPAALELLNDPDQSGTSVTQWAEYTLVNGDGLTRKRLLNPYIY